MSEKDRTIAVASINLKGGVGKTTLALILAQMALIKRQKVLAIDLDPQSNFEEGLSFIEGYFKGSLRVKRTLEPSDMEAGEEWIILDCAPALNKALTQALDFADIAIVPVRPDYFSLANLDSLYDLAGKCGKDRNQMPLVKVGYDNARMAKLAEARLTEKGYPLAGRVPLHRMIPYNIAQGRIWSTGLTADSRRPFEQMYERIESAYGRMLSGNFEGAWG